MSKTSKIVLGVVVTLFVALALGAVATKKDSTPSSTPSVTLVPNSSSSTDCPSLLAKYVDLNQRAASVLDGINSTPGAAAALASEIHALVVSDVEAGRRLIDACPQYSYLTHTIDQLEATQGS